MTDHRDFLRMQADAWVSDEFFNHPAAEATYSLMHGFPEEQLFESMRDCAAHLIREGQIIQKRVEHGQPPHEYTPEWYARDFLERV